MCRLILTLVSLVFVNDTPATQIYTLSYTTLFRSLLRHPREAGLREGDGALEARAVRRTAVTTRVREAVVAGGAVLERDVFRERKSTRLNSSHPSISYAVFCLKKKRVSSNKQNRRI